jgi:hypothetical protein
MSGIRNTPPLEAKGRFGLRAPFPDVGNKFITVIAVRLFEDCEAQAEDVFKDYYEPAGLTLANYQSDASAGAAMVTLADAEGEIYYVPDTYIASYPNMGDVQYAHLVMSISLGPVPSTLDLTAIGTQVRALVQATVGVDNEVRFHMAPTTDVVSPEQHEANEIARQQQITNRQTIDADNTRLRQMLTSKDQTIEAYKALLIQHGILPA